MEPKAEYNTNKSITNEEYQEIKKVIEQLDSTDDLSQMAVNFAIGNKVYAAGQDPRTWEAGDLADEAYQEGLVINLLRVIYYHRCHSFAFKGNP